MEVSLIACTPIIPGFSVPLHNDPLLAMNNIEKIKVVHETAGLIKKDFAVFGVEIGFSGNVDLAYDELKNELAKHLVKIIQTDYQKLLNVLYRIDVDEKKINNVLQHAAADQYSSIIADLILEREWKKALTRKYFRDLEKDDKDKLDARDIKKLK